MRKLISALALMLVCITILVGSATMAESIPEGFLEEGEFVLEDEENGRWAYASDSLRIVIERKYTDDPVALYWWEAEIWTRNGEQWFLPGAKEGKHLSAADWPYKVAQRSKAVFAMNGDYAAGRYPSKSKSTGLIIRDGKALWSKTKSKQTANAFPNLDILAFMPDGSLAVFDYNEHTAQEYLDMGIQNCLCFGPWLIRDGMVNEEALAHVGKNRNPRTVIGMVENGHYVAIVAEGRTKRSKGCNLTFMTDRLLDKGCTVGFNLDGGQTSCMLFMGLQLNVAGGSANKYGSARQATELLSIGVSDQVTDRTPALVK